MATRYGNANAMKIQTGRPSGMLKGTRPGFSGENVLKQCFIGSVRLPDDDLSSDVPLKDLKLHTASSARQEFDRHPYMLHKSASGGADLR